MCGIAGVFAGKGRRANSRTLLEMAGELHHRGPDGVGFYLDDSFGMINTRLSIIDLVGGDQPLGTEDGRYWVMQNGEIYNYPELTAELTALGHVFSTHSDTEVLAHAYEEWGVDCLSRLNGEFAFAVWDRERQELFLARDRFGIRPLFLADFGGDFSFASEAKALLRHPRAVREIDPLGLVESLTLWCVLPDRSAFRGIRELPAGHYLRHGRDGLIEARRWWDMPFVPPAEERKDPVEALSAELLSLLGDATRIRLRADVPVGVYLSGGLDSAITAALTRRSTTQAVRGFALGFTDPRFDESEAQDRVARALSIDLTRIRIDGAQIAGVFPRVVELAEKPLLRTAPAPMLHLSGHVRGSGFKVVLTGEGADEAFGGYDLFSETMVRRFWARQPESKARPQLLRRLYPFLGKDLNRGGGLLQSFFGTNLSDTSDPLYSHRIRFQNTARCLRFLQPWVTEKAAAEGDSLARLTRLLPAGFGDLGGLSQAQYLEIHTFLEGYLLHAQGDRMLMGNSIEGRFAFLDFRVAEFAARVPGRFRLRGLKEKYLLRRAAATLLPPEIGHRRKHPYRAPILRAFVGPQAPAYVREMLAPDRLRDAGLFKDEAVGKLFQKCERNLEAGISEMDEMALVAALSTMLLHHRFVARPDLAPPGQPTRVVIGKTVHHPAELPALTAQ
ncbi:MAG: asparagine synthase (glutamine-hydrolyzing) [Limisphaerales bacterium]